MTPQLVTLLMDIDDVDGVDYTRNFLDHHGYDYIISFMLDDHLKPTDTLIFMVENFPDSALNDMVALSKSLID